MGKIETVTSVMGTKLSVIKKPSISYLKARRDHHRRSATGIGLIGIASLFAYLMFSSAILPSANLPPLSISIAVMIIFIGLYAAFIQTKYYENMEFFDLPFFLSLVFCQFFVNSSFFPMMEEFGSSAVNTIAFNSAVLIAVGSVLVVASFRSFLLVAAVAAILTISFSLSVSLNDWHLTQLAPFGTMAAVAIFVNYNLERISRLSFERGEELKGYLFNVLPESVVERMKEGGVIADAYSEVSVIFCDVVGFSDLAKRLPPKALVTVLEDLFELADRCASDLGVEKVKTIGDAYMAVSGGTICVDNPAAIAIEFGFRVREELAQARTQHGIEDLDLRISIHTGPAIGGIIGQSKRAYDYWGDTINIASRIQSCAEPGDIVTSEQTRLCAHHEFDFGTSRTAKLKGVGEVKVYTVTDRKSKQRLVRG